MSLDEQRQLAFPGRHHRLLLHLPGGAPAVPSRRFRLRVVSVADPSAANSVQLACLDLYGEQQEQQAQEAEQQQEPPAQRQQQQPGGRPHETEQPQPAADNPWAVLFAAQ